MNDNKYSGQAVEDSECILVLGELKAPNGNVAEHLSMARGYEFDHTFFSNNLTVDDLYSIPCQRLGRFLASFCLEAGTHNLGYRTNVCHNYSKCPDDEIRGLSADMFSRIGHVGTSCAHKAVLADVETFKWDGKKGKIGF